MEKLVPLHILAKAEFFLLDRHFDVWAKEGCRTSLPHKKKDPTTTNTTEFVCPALM